MENQIDHFNINRYVLTDGMLCTLQCRLRGSVGMDGKEERCLFCQTQQQRQMAAEQMMPALSFHFGDRDTPRPVPMHNVYLVKKARSWQCSIYSQDIDHVWYCTIGDWKFNIAGSLISLWRKYQVWISETWNFPHKLVLRKLTMKQQVRK